ncbi:MAG: hypothetical protein OXF54_23390 [Caldilineaceae bacterium]|uniref:Uncharacterized protein n=1 Tax=Caldilineaceae bacterium SB0675_bin_29 TaxID=2605266 RepID=A0A6B1G543_9CHLR|nr:hypothetical protein [Caldilineaceae bacterium]MYH63211.1 hypothetical protein [Caldilineaceae bacterium SB0675_bin_29]
MRKILLFAGAVAILVTLTQTAPRNLTVSRDHSELLAKRIYAYRDWQSTGVRIDQGDRVEIQAEGEWLYTPDEFHGPAGHPRFPAPSFYPVSSGSGGALIGRIGDTGGRFVVGERLNMQATQHGILYLRINDDILSDNDGWVAVRIDVTETEDSLP